MLTRRYALALVGAALGLIGAVLAVLPGRSRNANVTTTANAATAPSPTQARRIAFASAPTEPSAASSSPVAAPQSDGARLRLRTVRDAIEDPRPDAASHLLRMLDDEEAVVRLEAIDGLVAKKHVPALSRVMSMDPAADPFLAPTILVAIGELGRATPDQAQKRAAVDRLALLLAEEKRRNGTDSAGNVVTIVEALGTLGHPAGATILEPELADPFHDVAGRTAIVLALGQIGQPSSASALARLRTSRPAEATGERYDRQLESEMLAAIDDVSRALAMR